MTSEWRTIRAADFIDFNPRLSLKKGDIATKVAMDKLKPFTKKIPETEKAEFNGGAKFCNGDTVMARITPCLENGKTAYVDMLDDGEIGFGSTEFIVMRAKTGISDPQFVYYTAINPVFRNVAIKSMVGSSGRQRVQQSVLEELELSVPDLEEQRRIGAFLARIDEKIALNDRINDNLEQQLRTIFKAEFTDNPELEKMTQIPLSELCHVVTKGTTPTTLGKPFVESGINFIKAESILADHSLDKSKFAFVDEETNALLKRSVIHAGDVVFTIAGTLGRFALIDNNVLPANTNQAVAIIRADAEKILPEYIYTCFIGEWHTDYYAKRIQQAVQANLSLTTIKSLPIPVLDKAKMDEYLRLILPLIKAIKGNEAQNEKLAALRDTLLPKLMSGEIDVSAIKL
ncbi:restriction endonuclease subunit S [[Clostridium] innocuum]|uniref:restriction endonuclease subunit S n=1 Tax=Clostridium innocuum TaxID=1522 RepID=UPI00210DCC3C|nr:restriction endonuclease subunit S [[Clostridium] innocuum]MCQ4709181.1 restriction endonuclease subunit S [[Clostridium] innocuum]